MTQTPEKTPASWTRHLGKVALLLGLIILGVVWSRYSGQLMGEALQQAGWKLIPLALLAFVWMPFDVLSMAVMLRPDRALPWLRLTLLEWSSESLGNLVPSAGMAGEPFRYRHIGDLTERPARTILMYRALHAETGLISTWASAALCAFLALAPTWPWWKLTWISGALSLVGLVLIFRWQAFPAAIVWKSLGWKCCTRVLQASEFAMLFWILGVDPTFERIAMIQGFVAASATLFAFIPGGIGVQEGVIVEGCTLLGLGGAFGFQMGFLRRARQLLWAGMGVLAAILLEVVVKRDVKSPAQIEPVDEPSVHPCSE